MAATFLDLYNKLTALPPDPGDGGDEPVTSGLAPNTKNAWFQHLQQLLGGQ